MKQKRKHKIMLQMGSMTLMFQKEIYIYNTSKFQLKIVLMTPNSQSWRRKSKLFLVTELLWEEIFKN